jgi:hypothetical protein
MMARPFKCLTQAKGQREKKRDTNKGTDFLSISTSSLPGYVILVSALYCLALMPQSGDLLSLGHKTAGLATFYLSHNEHTLFINIFFLRNQIGDNNSAFWLFMPI